MPIKITMPALSPTMTEGKLSKWYKAEGDEVSAGDVIAEIETDKATMEVEAVDEGVLAKIIVPEGTDSVPVNDLIAILLEDGEDADVEAFVKEVANGGDVVSSSSHPREGGDLLKPAPEKDSRLRGNDKNGISGGDKRGRVIASPLARRLARQKNIDLTKIKGSGPHGRVVKADIDRGPVSACAASGQAGVRGGGTMPQGIDARQLADQLGMPYRVEENSGVRKVIARRLLESKQTVPHYYLTIESKLDALLESRKQINTLGEEQGYKVSVNDFIIKAAALALRKVPTVNSSWTDEAVLYYDDVDISVAVATDNGLITPIIKNADRKSVVEISKEVKDLAARARDGKLKPEEFQGGTLTVSNLGMFGIKGFSAIINPPQSCILAVGAGEKRPMFNDAGDIVAATMMSTTGSFDHRSVDGAVGAEFMAAFKTYIENPAGLLIGG